MANACQEHFALKYPFDIVLKPIDVDATHRLASSDVTSKEGKLPGALMQARKFVLPFATSKLFYVKTN